MFRAFLGAAFLTLAAAVLPGKAADEKKTPAPTPEPADLPGKAADEKKAPAPKVEKQKPYVPAGQLTGTIARVDESKRSLRINIGKKSINPVAKDAYDEALKAARKARTSQEKLAAMEQAKAAEKDLVVNHLELQTTEDVVIRVPQPPAQFDEKGRHKKYTAKELKELKGGSKLPGYQGDFSSLRQRQVVQVTLVKKKEAARGGKGREAGSERPHDNQPLANMVIVVSDPGN